MPIASALITLLTITFVAMVIAVGLARIHKLAATVSASIQLLTVLIAAAVATTA